MKITHQCLSKQGQQFSYERTSVLHLASRLLIIVLFLQTVYLCVLMNNSQCSDIVTRVDVLVTEPFEENQFHNVP